MLSSGPRPPRKMYNIGTPQYISATAPRVCNYPHGIPRVGSLCISWVGAWSLACCCTDWHVSCQILLACLFRSHVGSCRLVVFASTLPGSAHCTPWLTPAMHLLGLPSAKVTAQRPLRVKSLPSLPVRLLRLFRPVWGLTLPLMQCLCSCLAPLPTRRVLHLREVRSLNNRLRSVYKMAHWPATHRLN